MISAKAIAIIVGAIVVVGGGALIISHKSNSAAGTSVENAAMTASSTSPAAQSSGKKIPFADMVKQGGSYQCTVHQAVAGFNSTSMVYISNGMMSVHIDQTVQGKAINTTFIQRDGYDYTWTSYAPTMGFKVPVSVVTDANANAKAAMSAGGAASGSFSWNANQVGDYDCQPWSPDASKFALPSSVKFTEMMKAQ